MCQNGSLLSNENFFIRPVWLEQVMGRKCQSVGLLEREKRIVKLVIEELTKMGKLHTRR